MKIFLSFLAIILLTSTLFGAYDVKIAVYKNGKNLRNTIAHVKSVKYRKSIVVKKKGNLYYAHAVFSSKKEAQYALTAYKKLFRDAFIAKEQIKVKAIKPVSIKKIKKKETKSVPSKINQNPKTEKVPVAPILIDAKSLLQNKTVYLCYDNYPKDFTNRVVKMVFSEKNVNYMPLDNKDAQLDINYTFKDDSVILELFDMNITHQIDGETKEYLKASNSVKDVLVYTVRYYFDEQKALDFLDKKVSKR